MINNKNVQTLDDYIRYGQISPYTIPQVSFFTKNENLIMLDEVVYSKYYDLIMSVTEVLDLNDEEYSKYRLNPQALSNELYGTPNLDHLLLFINNTSEFEFNLRRIRIIRSDILLPILKRIINHELPDA